jgi:hypothetical protein
MKTKILAISFILISCLPIFFFGQSDEDFKKKYWTYCERMKKYFLVYGVGPGKSLIHNQYNIDKDGATPQVTGTYTTTTGTGLIFNDSAYF